MIRTIPAVSSPPPSATPWWHSKPTNWTSRPTPAGASPSWARRRRSPTRPRSPGSRTSASPRGHRVSESISSASSRGHHRPAATRRRFRAGAAQARLLSRSPGRALAGVLAVAGLAVMVIVSALVIRRILDRRRMAGWDTEWSATGPQWCRLPLTILGRGASLSAPGIQAQEKPVTVTESVPPQQDRAGENRRLLACGQLPVGGPDIPDGQSAAARAAAAGAHQAAPAGPLGHHPGAQPDLRPSQPGDPQLGSQHDLRHGARARRPGHRGEHLPRGHLQRVLPQHQPGRGRDAAPVPPVLLPRRDTESRRAGDPRLHPRGRRAGLFAVARLWRGLRHPGPHRGVRRRRRGGGDRAAGHRMALEQVPRPRRATARCCPSCT